MIKALRNSCARRQATGGRAENEIGNKSDPVKIRELFRRQQTRARKVQIQDAESSGAAAGALLILQKV